MVVMVGKSDAFGVGVDDGAEVETDAEGDEVESLVGGEAVEDGVGKKFVCLRTSLIMLLVGATAGALVDAEAFSPSSTLD